VLTGARKPPHAHGIPPPLTPPRSHFYAEAAPSFYDITRTQPARKRGAVNVSNDDALSSASTVFTHNKSIQRQKALAEAHAKYRALLQQQEEVANQLEIFKNQEADHYASKIREMHSLQRSFRNLLNPEAAFARADIDGSLSSTLKSGTVPLAGQMASKRTCCGRSLTTLTPTRVELSPWPSSRKA
jgi:vacuolar-type H+-ATPase subunit I/STV1